MAKFVDSEQCIKKLFPVGTFFPFGKKDYRIVICGKPRPMRGECKTDVYIQGVSADGEVQEIKISVKQENADFLENKMSFDRACEIFGENASSVIKQCVYSIKERFLADCLVYFKQYGKTEAHTMKLGWKFELLNKLSGEKSGVLELTEKQKYDVFAGINLSPDKKNCYVNGRIVNGSGVANYVLNISDDNITQNDCLRMLEPIEDYAKSKTIYFACKALNYRFDENKWDGPRPLSVYVDWFINNDGKLDARLIFDEPLKHNGNEVGSKLKAKLKELKIKEFGGLKDKLALDVKCYF